MTHSMMITQPRLSRVRAVCAAHPKSPGNVRPILTQRRDRRELCRRVYGKRAPAERVSLTAREESQSVADIAAAGFDTRRIPTPRHDSLWQPELIPPLVVLNTER